MKKFTASLLSMMLIISYYSPVMSQNSNDYEIEIIPPVSEVVKTQTDNTQPNNTSTLTNNYYNATTETQTQQKLQPLLGGVATAPRGTNFTVTTSSTINTMSSKVGDTFSAIVEEPVVIDAQTVIPSGSELLGQISYIESAGRIGKDALMDVRFTSVKLPNGERIPINAKVITTDSSGVIRGGRKSNIVIKATGTAAGATAAGAAAGTGMGALLGSVAGGALFGTAVGGVVGVGYALYRKGKEIILPSGTQLGIILEQPLTISTTKIQ